MFTLIIGGVCAAGAVTLMVMGLFNYGYMLKGEKDEKGRQKVLSISPVKDDTIFGWEIKKFKFWFIVSCVLIVYILYKYWWRK